jgi:hypothetical protein
LLSQGVLQVVVKGGDEDGGVGEKKKKQFWWFAMHSTNVLEKSLRKFQYAFQL